MAVAAAAHLHAPISTIYPSIYLFYWSNLTGGGHGQLVRRRHFNQMCRRGPPAGWHRLLFGWQVRFFPPTRSRLHRLLVSFSGAGEKSAIYFHDGRPIVSWFCHLIAAASTTRTTMGLYWLMMKAQAAPTAPGCFEVATGLSAVAQSLSLGGSVFLLLVCCWLFYFSPFFDVIKSSKSAQIFSFFCGSIRPHHPSATTRLVFIIVVYLWFLPSDASWRCARHPMTRR